MIAVTDDWHHRDRRHRPAHEANRLAIRPPRRRLFGPGLPLEAGRPRPAARAVRRRPRRFAVWSRDASARCHGRRLASPSRPCRAAESLALGGLVGGSSTDWVLAGPPGSLRRVGSLPTATHDAAAVTIGRSVYLFGGGEQVSSPAIVRVDPATGTARRAARSASRSPISAASPTATSPTSSAATRARASRRRSCATGRAEDLRPWPLGFPRACATRARRALGGGSTSPEA